MFWGEEGHERRDAEYGWKSRDRVDMLRFDNDVSPMSSTSMGGGSSPGNNCSS